MTNRLDRLRRRLRSSAAGTLPLSAAAASSRSRSMGKNGRGKGKKQHYCLSPFLASGKSNFLTVGALALLTFGIKDYYEPAGKKSSSITSSPVIQKKKYDAVIVGAGWAGIKAAQTLIENGVENILVLEAHDYIGGRSKALNLDGSINNPAMHGNFTNIPIDMGSEWLYVGSDIEKSLIEKGYMKGVDRDAHFVPIEDSAFYLQTMVHEDNNAATATLKTERVGLERSEDLMKRVGRGFIKYREKLLAETDADDETAATKWDQSYWSAVEDYKKKELTNEVDIQFMDMVLAAAGEVVWTGEASKTSLVGDVIIEAEGPLHMHYTSVPGVGYGNTAAKYAAPLVANKVLLNSKVTEIDYSNSNSAMISFTTNGEEENKVIAKTVLVTVSLGVLKAGNIKFTPSLPEWKQKVIDGMGFGTMNKCVLTWNDPNAVVWPDNEWIELMTPKGDDSGDWTTFFNPTEYKGIPILVGFVGGKNAHNMESQSDEEVLGDVMKNLKAMFPTITPPDRHVITRWGKEENVLGTYSYKAVGRDYSADSRQLKKTVNNVWFAGEATSSWYGTTVGAWRSGEAAAVGMLKALNVMSYSYVDVFWSLWRKYR